MAAPQATAHTSAEAAQNGVDGQEGPKQHIRTYQACIPCRKRKVRCDLGSVDAPHDPPCVRCRRESKECYFSATRRKRKTTEGDEEEEDEVDDEYTRNNRRKRTRGSQSQSQVTPTTSTSAALHTSPTANGNNSTGPLTPGGHVGASRPLRRGSGLVSQDLKIDDEENERVSNETAAHLQRGEIFGGHDALNLLATASAGLHRRTASMSSNRPSVTNANTPGSLNSLASPQASGSFAPVSRHATQDELSFPTSQPVVPDQVNGSVQVDANTGTARLAWLRLLFVRSGWFTPEEGMQYIEYFYAHIAPLTPVAIPDFREPEKHETLLDTEPMLAITMLTVASRYMKLSGPGATSRAYAIHSKLWAHLQDRIDRVIWGQELYGGNFVGVGSQPGSDINPLHRKGLRTLGTVESFMILTEWHPRALHFPPGDVDAALLISDEPVNVAPVAPGGQRMYSWLEPCWRSDRMCWMLLGNAFHLAIEIGVFDDTSQKTFLLENKQFSGKEVKEYYARKDHLRDLLQVYLTQTTGRLGLTSMLPKTYMADAFVGTTQERLLQRMNKFAASSHNNLSKQPPPTQLTALNANPQEMTLHFWVELAAIMHMGNQRMFPNRRITRELIRKGEYVSLLKTFEPMLTEWLERFEACESIPQHMRHIVKIEFEYARVYLHCLALQAVVERCTHNSPPMLNLHTMDSDSASPSKDGGSIPPAILSKWIGDDRQYIEIVVDACRNVLKIVNEGLFPNDFLKHVPVRTCFRIVSVIIILLKTFALGAFEKDVEVSLGLVDKAVEALGSAVVDDVHVINSFTELATILTQRIRSRLVRLATNGSTNGKTQGFSPSPQYQPSSQFPPMAPPNKTNKTLSNAQNATATQWGDVFGNSNGNGPYGYYPGSNTSTSQRYSLGSRPTNPLYGISTQSYDPDTNNVSIVPPPTFGNGVYDPRLSNNDFGYTNVGNGDGGDNSDWLTLPLDNLFTNHHGLDVTQTSYGPDVGGMDLLDVLLDPTTGPMNFQ